MKQLAETADVSAHLRILLAHSPDAIDWARETHFDLLLAGHTHGGQFRIPGYGAFVCPIQEPLELSPVQARRVMRDVAWHGQTRDLSSRPTAAKLLRC